MADIAVLILGGSGSGKTSFMLGMYADMRRGRQGITLTASPNEDRELTAAWRRLNGGGGREKRFPSPTDDFVEINISMLYAFRRFMTFAWLDYPGRELYRNEKGELHEKLERSVRQAKTIFICLPGDQLIEYVKTGDAGIDGRLTLWDHRALVQVPTPPTHRQTTPARRRPTRPWSTGGCVHRWT